MMHALLKLIKCAYEFSESGMELSEQFRRQMYLIHLEMVYAIDLVANSSILNGGFFCLGFDEFFRRFYFSVVMYVFASSGYSDDIY